MAHLQGLSLLAGNYTSISDDGAVYKSNNRRAYRSTRWIENKPDTKGWIFYDDISAVWRFDNQRGEYNSPPQTTYSPEEYFDDQGNSLGYYIPNLLLDFNNRSIVITDGFIRPDCTSASPVGDWFVNDPDSPNSQDVNPVLTCIEGEMAITGYDEIRGDITLDDYSKMIGNYVIKGEVGTTRKITYLTKNPDGDIPYAISETISLTLEREGEVTFEKNGNKTRLLPDDFVVLKTLSGSEPVLIELVYLKKGSSYFGFRSGGGVIRKGRNPGRQKNKT